MDKSVSMETQLGPGQSALSCWNILEKLETGFMDVWWVLYFIISDQSLPITKPKLTYLNPPIALKPRGTIVEQSLSMETQLGLGQSALSCWTILEKQETGFMDVWWMLYLIISDQALPILSRLSSIINLEG